MDLSLSADFDSSLLDWDETDDGPNNRDKGTQQESDATSGSQTQFGGNGEHGGLKRSLNSQLMKEGMSRLPSFPMAIGGLSASTETNGQQSNPPTVTTTQTLTNPYAVQMLYPLTGQNAAQANGSAGYSQQQQQKQQQQQQNLLVQYALTGQSTGAPFPSVTFQSKSQVDDTVSSLSATTGNVSAVTGPAASSLPGKPASQSSAKTATVTASTTQPMARSTNQHNQQGHGMQPTPQLHPLGIPSSAVCPPMSVSNGVPQFNPYMLNPYSVLASNPQLLAAYQNQQQMAANFAAAAAQASQASVAATKPPAPTAKTARKPRAPKQKSKKASKNKEDDAPPFLLFDAPCELRQNFMNTQRMLNLPVLQDGNSYHYGMSVNGFHPQLNVATDPVRPVSSTQPILPAGVDNVRLLDSRHKKGAGGKERNEREQKRAQKITELIEQIRTSMEDGGWKVEIKSKYHTLSMCADYVKHLIKATEEKEEAVEKAKSDLEVKERKLEEDKTLLEGRSDPESVTSSLTASTANSGKGDRASCEAKTVSDSSSGNKRKAEEIERDSANNDVESKKAKTVRAKTDDAKVEESNEDSSGADDGGSGPSGHNISIGKMSSSVSELTDSNRGSSDSGGEKRNDCEHAAHKKHPRSDEDESSEIPSSSSISSTAAVLRGAGSHHREHGHADVVIKQKKRSRHRKRNREERSSLDRKFVIDYEEVFLTSNVPQILATPAGRIVAWNKFFLKATGLDQGAVQRLTIFSLVQPDKLANLFEMVAEALRQKGDSSSSGTSTSADTTVERSSGTEGSEGTTQTTEYATMTLPCTSLLSSTIASDKEQEKPSPLYMTVTLMPDDDIRRRCFHCLFTDCKGTDGKLGFVTPEMLAKLFAEPEPATEKLGPATSDADKAKNLSVDKSKSEPNIEMDIEVTDIAVDEEEDDDE